jgi:uncharacterized protein YbjT (DUF2867 family)
MILVTGGSGQVGSRVVQALLDSQQQVRVLTRGGSDWHENPLPHFRTGLPGDYSPRGGDEGA